MSIDELLQVARGCAASGTPDKIFELRRALARWDAGCENIVQMMELVLQRPIPKHPRIILRTLLEYRGTIVSHQRLHQNLWGDSIDGGPDTVNEVLKVQIHRVRGFIRHSRADLVISCVYARGYQIDILQETTNATAD